MTSKRIVFFSLLALVFTTSLVSFTLAPKWGFFGHRKINRMAVFTLPQEMMPLFKSNIDYLEEHAVDPDKRRYATEFEAIRHYIDVDHWDTYPFEKVPRTYEEAIFAYAQIQLVDLRNDTLLATIEKVEDGYLLTARKNVSVSLPMKSIRKFMFDHVMFQISEGPWSIPALEIPEFNKTDVTTNIRTIIITDQFSEYGVLPYYLETGLRKLTTAFEQKNKRSILRNAADLGHYIGDAHVPLHTTENYNGQMTNQIGIHAFWESRLPELFSEETYDFFAGKAEYIENPSDYFWSIVLASHALLDDVLQKEKDLSLQFPSDQQWCFDERLDRTVRIQCPAYAKAYHSAMGTMVEDRMVASVKAIGDVWYTAWINAGQPDLKNLKDEIWVEEPISTNPEIKTREHSN